MLAAISSAIISSQRRKGTNDRCAQSKPPQASSYRTGDSYGYLNLRCFEPLQFHPAQHRRQTHEVILMVNVASQCGFTPQYTALETIYNKYKDQGFVILGFPANNFGQQEPGTDEEIKTFCSRKYSVTFPLYSKISVKGSDQAPLYQYLTKDADPSHSGNIKWNFTKFLVDRNGNVVQRFEPAVTPDSPDVTSAIEKLLKQ
jgi:glutathione peroxidase